MNGIELVRYTQLAIIQLLHSIITVGRMEIMISQLAPPVEARLLRRVDPHFIKVLKSSMMRDPTGTGSPPAIVFTNQVAPMDFDHSLKDAYK